MMHWIKGYYSDRSLYDRKGLQCKRVFKAEQSLEIILPSTVDLHQFNCRGYWRSSPKGTLLQGVHRGAGLALECLRKMVGVLHDTIDTPFSGRVIIVIEPANFLFRGCVATESTRVLDKEELLKRV